MFLVFQKLDWTGCDKGLIGPLRHVRQGVKYTAVDAAIAARVEDSTQVPDFGVSFA